MKKWHFTVTSELSGPVDYGPYDSQQEAEQAITRIKESATVLVGTNRCVGRTYSQPEKAIPDECPQCGQHGSLTVTHWDANLLICGVCAALVERG